MAKNEFLDDDPVFVVIVSLLSPIIKKAILVVALFDLGQGNLTNWQMNQMSMAFGLFFCKVHLSKKTFAFCQLKSQGGS